MFSLCECVFRLVTSLLLSNIASQCLACNSSFEYCSVIGCFPVVGVPVRWAPAPTHWNGRAILATYSLPSTIKVTVQHGEGGQTLGQRPNSACGRTETTASIWDRGLFCLTQKVCRKWMFSYWLWKRSFQQFVKGHFCVPTRSSMIRGPVCEK